MTSWKTARIWLLAALFTGVVCVLVKLIFFPHPSPKLATTTPFVFPTTVSFPEWQLLDSKPLQINNEPNIIASRRYQYQKNGTDLNIDIHYLTKFSGTVKSLIKKHIASQQATIPLLVRQASGVGFHALFTYQGKAFLSSCMNPRGGSTVTFDQFRANRNTYDMQLNRIFLWLLGVQELRDWRCLWNVLSIPLNTAKPEEIYPILESAWFSWYSWWKPHFPQP